MRHWPNRFFYAVTLLAALSFGSSSVEAGRKEVVTDMAGRSVEIELPVKRMILGEGRFLPSLAILDREDPVDWIAGMMGDFKRYDPAGYASYLARVPEVADIPPIGDAGAASFSLEQAISLQPDIAVFGLGSTHGPNARHKDILEKLEAAGVPVIVIDFRVNPLVNTPKSLALLGRLMGREAEAASFNAFYREELARVRDGLQGVGERPSVFMELHVGLRPQCCAAMGRQMMGRFIEWAGGRNLVGEKIPGTHGMVNLEYLLVTQPDVYIGTAIGSALGTSPESQKIVLGAGADLARARSSFSRASDRSGIRELAAIRSGRAHAIWHNFYNTPMNVAAVQAMAKWLHPDRFQDLSPTQTLETFFERFQPVPLDGTYWVSLTPEAETQ